MSDNAAPPDRSEAALVETIPESLSGERLDRIVSLLAGLSRSAATTSIRSGHVRINDEVDTGRARRVDAGDVLTIDELVDSTVKAPEPDASIPLTVVHDDDHVIVIEKAPELVVHPGAGNDDGTLVNALLARYPEIAEVGERGRPGIVHRLDRGTSGLLMVARSPLAYDELRAQLIDRSVERAYETMVKGHVAAGRGVVDAAIGRGRRDPTKMVISQSGKEARTNYETGAIYDEPIEVTRLVCRLETGRTHQIRVHMNAIGHPVLGDPRYGGIVDDVPCSRPWLHAATLGFLHPSSGTPLRFESPVPADLATIEALFT